MKNTGNINTPYKKKTKKSSIGCLSVLLIILVILLLSLLLFIFAYIKFNNTNSDSTQNRQKAETHTSAEPEPIQPTEDTSPENNVSTQETPHDNLTLGQENALKQAENYLNIMAFSRKGLIEQLEYEGYSTEDATYAVDNCNANWSEQAVKKAKDYLDTMAFSRSGLIEQLEYEGFTYEEAVYGVEQNGY